MSGSSSNLLDSNRFDSSSNLRVQAAYNSCNTQESGFFGPGPPYGNHQPQQLLEAATVLVNSSKSGLGQFSGSLGVTAAAGLSERLSSGGGYLRGTPPPPPNGGSFGGAVGGQFAATTGRGEFPPSGGGLIGGTTRTPGLGEYTTATNTGALSGTTTLTGVRFQLGAKPVKPS